MCIPTVREHELKSECSPSSVTSVICVTSSNSLVHKMTNVNALIFKAIAHSQIACNDTTSVISMSSSNSLVHK